MVIFLTFFLALLVKMDAAGEDHREALASLLVAINVFLVVVALTISWFGTKQQVRCTSISMIHNS